MAERVAKSIRINDRGTSDDDLSGERDKARDREREREREKEQENAFLFDSRRR